MPNVTNGTNNSKVFPKTTENVLSELSKLVRSKVVCTSTHKRKFVHLNSLNNLIVNNKKRGRPAKTLDPSLHMFEGLPVDLNVSFSEWFYKNIKQKKTPHTTQLYLDQLAQLNSPVENNDDVLKLLTQDINHTCDDLEPIKKLTDYRLSIKEKFHKNTLNGLGSPSKNKLSVDNNQSPTKLTTNLSKQRPKPPLNELTLTIETVITTIDYRPMLKKKERLKTNLNDTRDGSLIAPDEECDNSEPEDIIEIDCDL